MNISPIWIPYLLVTSFLFLCIPFSLRGYRSYYVSQLPYTFFIPLEVEQSRSRRQGGDFSLEKYDPVLDWEAVSGIPYLPGKLPGRTIPSISFIMYAMLRVHETVRKEPHCFIISSLESFLIYIHEECL